jgi:hypothetical protein
VSIHGEVRAFNRLLAENAVARVVSHLDPLDNARIAAATGADPFVWTGGLSSRARDYTGFQRAWQGRGVPTYVVDTGSGFTPVRDNAAELRRTIERALNETGADRVWVGGQSKGTIDTRWALQHEPELLDSINGAFLVVGPHRGGLTTHEGVSQAVRGVTERLPGPIRNHMRASTELIATSPELRAINESLPRFLDEAPEHFVVHNFVTDVMPRGLPSHDGLVPLASQRLIEHPRVVEHQLARGPNYHITAHVNRQFTETVEDVMATRRLEAPIA